MKMRTLALAVLLLGSPLLAVADECDNASTQSQLNSCTSGQYQAADKKLNQTYQAALKRATQQQAAMLKKAQQSWVTVRDSDCALMSSGVEGGSAQPMVLNQCLADKTNEREAWLASLLQCGEGDLSCPLPPGH